MFWILQNSPENYKDAENFRSHLAQDICVLIDMSFPTLLPGYPRLRNVIITPLYSLEDRILAPIQVLS